ncbi:MAG: DUF3987 domain-containing protein [Bacteroidaceae bacterium]|nr:DUF3987 domain-containing protein [Bacteroidaceae bacterium]
MKPIMTNMEQASRPAPATDSQQAAKAKLAGRIGPSLSPKSSEPAINVDKYSVREVQGFNPLPKKLDPFTKALLDGCDPVSAHQALTLTFPIMAFMGNNARVLYTDGTLRWVSGQSWQMGGSGCGKSLVLRSLERIFLSEELEKNRKNAEKAAAYSLLSEKERQDTPIPQEEVRILDTVPTAVALLEQMQINGGGAVYISCSEAGEFGKKIGSPYYAIILDMMKKSYDGTGEPFMHKTKSKMYYVPSMKLCFNIGGTIDPMYKILRHCNADGTLSRGSLTILGERKDEKKEGKYRAPQWNAEQREVLQEAANRLRNFDNTYRENLSFRPANGAERSESNLNLDLNQNENEKNTDNGDKGIWPLTSEEYNARVHEERIRRALRVDEILQLGGEIKEYIISLGQSADSCCSRADERAMGLAYLLHIANGEQAETLPDIINVVRWWVKSTIDCAMAVQSQLNEETKSRQEAVCRAYKRQASHNLSDILREKREEAFRDFEEKYGGMEVSGAALREYEVFAKMDSSYLRRLIVDRGYESVGRNLYRVVKKEEAA